MSSLDPADPASAPEPANPSLSSAEASPPEPAVGTSGPIPPSAPVPASSASAPGSASGPGPAPVAPVAPGAAFEPTPVRVWADGPGPATERRRQNGIALYATIALIVALAFGSGMLVGRATVAGDGTAAAPLPVGSESPAVPSGSTAPGSSSAASGTPAAPSASDPLAGLPSDGALLGSKSAKVQLTYWADFQCPFCAKFAQEILPQLASRIADGTVSVLHRDFVFIGPESVEASIAVRCAGEQGEYWPMHDAVYAAQNGENEGAFSTAKLLTLATGVGVDGTKFTACTTRHDVLVSVLAETSAGMRAGVKSTPTIDVPGQTFLGVTDVNAFLAAIDAAAKNGTQPTPAPSLAAPSGDPWASTATSGRTSGKASAPVTVELWVDYQATGMPAIVGNLEPELRARIDAGKVQVQLRDLATLGDESVVAASFIRCAADNGESFVWFAHDILGSSSRGANAGIYTVKALLGLGAKFGWDIEKLDACMADPATASAIKAETADGAKAGLNAAPAVVVKASGKEVAQFSGSSLDVAKVLAAIDAAAK